MPADTRHSVGHHYGLNALLDSLLGALAAAGKDIDRQQRADLAPVDEFFICAREATLELAGCAGIDLIRNLQASRISVLQATAVRD